ncbi:MAG: hypothetical protein A2413_03255 [Treponema sp. RIFOXYC1_FULL_61_9]|nr:MAG: hypothetical protein A2413_03255 [Treponema sp. RIFOXYC1_FULL_61_9]
MVEFFPSPPWVLSIANSVRAGLPMQEPAGGFGFLPLLLNALTTAFACSSFVSASRPIPTAACSSVEIARGSP